MFCIFDYLGDFYFFKWTGQKRTITQFMFDFRAGGCTCTDILYFGTAFLLSYLF